MSNSLAIATVTAAMAAVVERAAQNALEGTQVTVTTRRPDDQKNGQTSARVNIYLFQALPNAAWRNVDLPTRRGDGSTLQRPQAALDLHYLLTFYGDETKLEPQRLLAASVSALHARPVLPREAIRTLIQNAQDPHHAYHFLVTSDLAEQVELVRWTPRTLDLEELSKLWSVFFQTPYALSVAYQASVVLVEEQEEVPQVGLPVRSYNVRAAPFSQPSIEQVIASEGENAPITIDSTLVIRGQRLAGEVTLICIGSAEVSPDSLSAVEARVALPALPAGSLQAGVQGVQVVHKQPMGGGSSTLVWSGGSEIAPFVLRPVISRPAPTPPETEPPEVPPPVLSDVEPTLVNGQPLIVGGVTLLSGTVTVHFAPRVGRRQRVRLLLNELNPPSDRRPHAGSFDAPAENGIADPEQQDTDVIEFATSRVWPGTYLVRVQVDGAESVLAVDSDGAYSAPTVTYA